MSATEWKPGDVAVVRCGDDNCESETHPAMSCSRGRWWIMDDGTYSTRVTPLRRLVVLDPESADDVVRVGSALGIVGDELLQAALRELANPTPPKPAEPTGLGAVVEDKAGCMWIRSGSSHADPNWRRCGEDDWHDYSQIAAVRVLSEGVVPE